MYVDNCGSICAPVPGLLVSLGIDVELGQEGLDIILVLDVQKARIEVLSEYNFSCFCLPRLKA